MLVIGIAGGVASGKSLVAQCFKHFGASLLDADQIGHEVLKDPAIIERIAGSFDGNILKDGEVDRTALAEIVFDPRPQGTQALLTLEKITHPEIGRRIRVQLEKLKSDALSNAVVLDAPVMFKANWDRMCDKIVFVHTDLELRQRRASQRGWDDDEISKREAYQTPIDEKRSKSTDEIDNSKSKEHTYEQARKLWLSWELELPEQLDLPSHFFKK